MAQITLRQAAAWCGGTFEERYGDVVFCGANNDSRKLQPGELFVALRGARDGHEFIEKAFEQGAAAVLCSRMEEDRPAIIVPDTRIALGQIARGLREVMGLQVVGVTGSVGKSTTKEMIACVLEGSFRVAKTPANFNNDIGLPLAILAMPADTQVAVLEMGMNHFGEISYLSRIAQPQVAVITNIGTMHMENLGSREGILKAKLEILEGMDARGKVILNGDDRLLCTAKPVQPVTFFGHENAACDVTATETQEHDGGISCRVSAGKVHFDMKLPVEGMHFVSDALAAVSVGLAFGVGPEVMAERLANFRTMRGRQEILQVGGFTIISDCYNAGPESMAAALAVLGKRTGRKIAVLGDMLELGTGTQAEHYKVGRLSARNADYIFAYGPNAKRVASGALTGGVPVGRVELFDDREKLIHKLKCMLCPGDTVLVKGSHGMHLETVVEQLCKEET